jgi:hypothetical protein
MRGPVPSHQRCGPSAPGMPSRSSATRSFGGIRRLAPWRSRRKRGLCQCGWRVIRTARSSWPRPALPDASRLRSQRTSFQVSSRLPAWNGGAIRRIVCGGARFIVLLSVSREPCPSLSGFPPSVTLPCNWHLPGISSERRVSDRSDQMRMRTFVVTLAVAAPLLALESRPAAAFWCGWGWGSSSYGYSTPRSYGYYGYAPRTYGYAPRYYGGAYYGRRLGWRGYGYRGWRGYGYRGIGVGRVGVGRVGGYGYRGIGVRRAGVGRVGVGRIGRGR